MSGEVRLVQAELFELAIPFKEAFRHSHGARAASDSLVVAVTAADGTRGWGEALPRPYVTGETTASAWAAIAATLWPALRDRPVRVDEDLLAAITTILPPAAAADGVVANAARCALELAAVDCALRASGIAPERLLPASPAAAAVRYSGVIGAMAPDAAEALARRYRRLGLGQIKVKVGDAGDVERVARVRAAIGDTAEIRVDANGAWSAAVAAARLAEMAAAGVALCEDPLPRARRGELPALLAASPVTVALDESLIDRADAEVALGFGRRVLFHLRLSKNGGLGPTLELAAMAAAAGVEHGIGCQVGESSILAAAGLRLARHLAPCRYLEGAFGTHLLSEDLTAPAIEFGAQGRPPALPAIGLGPSVDGARVRRHARRSEVLA